MSSKNAIFHKIITLILIFLIAIAVFGKDTISFAQEMNDANKINVEYEYDKVNNQVIAKMKSKIPLKHTKPTWDLSEDKLTYTKTFTENMDYSTGVEDKNGNKYDVNIKINQIVPNKVIMEYEYDKINNQVIAKMKSKFPLKHTKPTWYLSEDKLTYTKTFTENTEYSTIAEDANGNKYDIFIKINQIEDRDITIEYEYDEVNNKVLAKVNSLVQLKHTKPTWDLSEDKLVYTKSFTQNTEYSTIAEDINGKMHVLNIKINQIMENQIIMTYEYDEIHNRVLATMKSKFPLKHTKPTWDLSEDKLTYTKLFANNMDYSTPVEDANGNKYDINIQITGILDNEITLEYEYDIETNTVLAKMVSRYPLEHTKPTWNLSEDKLTYTKLFVENMNYYTLVYDFNGKQYNMNIQITDIRDTIQKTYNYDKETNLVTVVVTSEYEFIHTKPTWTLSEDNLTYTKTFNYNSNYNTNFTEKSGKVTSVNLNIDRVDDKGPEITKQYRYNPDGTLTVYLKSNEKMANTKPSWSLSEDKLTYTKTFDSAQNYSTDVFDMYGNTSNVTLNFRYCATRFDDKKAFVAYIITEQQRVVVQIVSDIELQNTKPTWELSSDAKVYTKTFTEYQDYTTPIVDINGNARNIHIDIDYLYIIPFEKGVYGQSGLKVAGSAKGSNLIYYKIGSGPNVMFATFSVHGFEDLWAHDGEELTYIAEQFRQAMQEEKNKDIAKKWTIYIFPCVNPDGQKYGTTNNGSGRTTLYSKLGYKGIDLNRCWSVDFVPQTTNRNYTGSSAFQAYEAIYLRDFLLSHKSSTGQTVLIDLHGWLNETLGDQGLSAYYTNQLGMTGGHTNAYGRGYLINWARTYLGNNNYKARSALIELPVASNHQDVVNRNFAGKYIQATVNMLRGII